MQQEISLRLAPAEAADERKIREKIANHLGKPVSSISGFHILKKSLDARGRNPQVQLRLRLFMGETIPTRLPEPVSFRQVAQSPHRVLIAGAGPAGLFAALRLMELGIQPILLERGKDVRSRRRDLAALNRSGLVNPESNYCFGEGGAGTYSDGKLYTRSNKRGDIDRILRLLVQFGADERILYEAHPHIGTNKLPHIITAIRECILSHGGEIHFEKKLTGLEIDRGELKAVITGEGTRWPARHLILATGHSARDIFRLLAASKITIESKPFALGVRAEHPQELIDQIQYHCPVRDPYLPPASYSLVQQVQGLGVFSFCMCPGGIIAPAATAPGEVVVNGWSPSKRNNPYANSGIVVALEEKDLRKYLKKNNPSLHDQLSVPGQEALAGLFFQMDIERKSFEAGGGSLVAPAQRMTDFVEGRVSASLPGCSYQPGVHSFSLNQVLPPFVANPLALAFKEFGRKMKGYLSREAILVATESRTSSPVRIPREGILLEHPQVKGLHPCGEGAGYAGGIVSAAMDGEKVATALAAQWG